MAFPSKGVPKPPERPTSEQRPVLSKTEARQGVTGHNVRYVLGFGLAAVIIAFAVIYFISFG
jgi:hypothetical protein